MKSSNGPSGPPLSAWPLTAHWEKTHQAGGQSMSGNTTFLMQRDSPSPPTGRPVPCAASS